MRSSSLLCCMPADQTKLKDLEYWTWHGVLAQWQVLWCLDCWHNHVFSTNCPSVPLFWQTTPFYCHVWVLLSFLLPASLHQSLWQRQILDLSGYKNTLLIPSASAFINCPLLHLLIDQLPQCSDCLLITKWVYWSTSWIILLLVDLNFQILLLVDQLLKCSCFLIQLLNDLCLLSYWSTSEWWCFFFPFWSGITDRKSPDWEACISWFSDSCPHNQDSA